MSETTAGQAPVAQLVAPLRAQPDAAAVLCDVDGTLAPIVARPEQAAVPAEARELLSELARRYALVACVSGRRAPAARELVGLDELTYIGNHGYERVGPGTTEPVPDPAVAGRAARAADFVSGLDWTRLESLGIRREDKGPIQALHWRGAAQDAAAEMAVREVAALAQSSDLIPRWGRKVLEVRPVAGIDKGSAVHRLLRESDGVSAALYAGDDRTDLDAFRALRWLAGSGRLGAAVTVGVASDEGPPEIRAEADLVVDGPEGMLEVLRELAD